MDTQVHKGLRQIMPGPRGSLGDTLDRMRTTMRRHEETLRGLQRRVEDELGRARQYRRILDEALTALRDE
jgi:hypothetical protein